MLAIASGLSIEILQSILNVGIFDIDDVILNAFGVMIGYGAFVLLAKWLDEKKHKTILLVISVAMTIMIAVTTFFGVSFYQDGHQSISPGVLVEEIAAPQSGDLCNGTGGTGKIVSTAEHTITIKSSKGTTQVIGISDQTTIKNSAGRISESDLKIGDGVVIVIYDNKTADTVLVCGVTR